MQLKKYTILQALLLIFYTVGIVGLSLDSSREMFLELTPLNLLLTLALIKWADGDFSVRGILAFVVVFLIGFWVEVAGVHTGVLFGEYQYGTPLGFQWLDVPLMIGVNWFILGYASAGLASYFVKNAWARILISAMLMVGLDVFIEPVAIELDFWQWAGGDIPIRNYLMWFVTALVVQGALHIIGNKKDRKAGVYVYFIQLYFFIALYFL